MTRSWTEPPDYEAQQHKEPDSLQNHKADSTKKDELREYIKDAECTGPYCNHETAETHYLVFDDIFGLIESAKAEAEIAGGIKELELLDKKFKADEDAMLKAAKVKKYPEGFYLHSEMIDDRLAELKAQQEEKR